MVNTGKPSNACFECRKRRIKCDAGKPECERCIKYQVICPGYPDPVPFKFREESSKVRERAVKQAAKSKKKATTSTSDGGRLVGGDGIQQGQAAALINSSDRKQKSDQPSLEQIRKRFLQSSALSIPKISVGNALTQGAVAAFMSQWSSGDPDLYWASFDGAALLYPTANQSSAYMSALEAVSLMTLLCTDKELNTDLRRPAMKAYGRSLALINKALEDPTQRTIDHTFMAIELVILFELLEGGLYSEFAGLRHSGAQRVATINHKVERVLAHLRGIMAVVSIRGRSQFAAPLGRRLFLTACVIWNLGSISMPEPLCIPLPEGVWEDLFHHDLGTYSNTYRLLPLQDRAIAVRKQALVKLEMELGLGEVIELLHSVEAIDGDLEALYASLPDQWISRTDMYAKFTLNLYRSYRIFMQDLLVRCYRLVSRSASYEYMAEMDAALALSLTLLDEICGSTPYNFGADESRIRSHGDFFQAQIPQRGVTIVFHLMFSFPLLVASMVAPVSEKQRKGIEQARLECARACGFARPIRNFPRTLLQSLEYRNMT